MIEVKDVVKTFDGFRALDGVTMTVPRGAVYGLVGPNGAGKSTLIRHLTGIYRPDSGAIDIDGQPGRIYGSQGQQRSAVLSLKLAEASTAGEILGEHPVMLLDDVLSELDDSRQAYLLTRIEDKQTFVTTCDSAAFARTNGKLVFVQGGRTSETPFDGTAVPAAMAARGTGTGETAQAAQAGQNNEGA